MKNIFPHSVLYYIVLFAVLIGIVSCQKYSDEDYEGMWQLIEISQPDGTAPRNVKADGVYWRIQLGILQILSTRIPTASNQGELIATFSVSGSTLRLNAIYRHEREADNIISDPAEAALLSPYGITAPTEEYHIDALTGSRLILTSSTQRLVFRKF